MSRAALFALAGLALLLLFPVCMLVYGFFDEDNTCQHGLRAGMTLTDFCKMVGYEGITLVALLAFSGISAALNMMRAARLIAAPTIYLHLAFAIVSRIIGIVILSTNENNRCVSRGVDSAVLAIIWIPIGIVVDVLVLVSTIEYDNVAA